jgi:hypothetical protein
MKKQFGFITAERGDCIYAPACQNKPIGSSNSNGKP